MALILATGSNLGDREQNLDMAKSALSQRFELVAASRIYQSKAVDYLEQPDFLNQVLEFQTPKLTPEEILAEVMAIERRLGREREIPKGPRLIDIDIIFIDFVEIQTNHLLVPHPSWQDRAFIVEPIQEIPFFEILKKHPLWLNKREVSGLACPILPGQKNLAH